VLTVGCVLEILHTYTHRSTQPSTLRWMVEWIQEYRRWCSATGKVTAGLAESNGSLPPSGWLKSPAGWLPVHQDQLQAQRSVTSIESLYFFLYTQTWVMWLWRCHTFPLSIRETSLTKLTYHSSIVWLLRKKNNCFFYDGFMKSGKKLTADEDDNCRLECTYN